MIRSYVILAEGIRIPYRSVSITWTAEGRSQAVINLVGSKEAESILESTHIHIYEVDPHRPVFERTPMEVSRILDRDRKFLLPQESESSVGGTVTLPWEDPDSMQGVYLDRFVSPSNMRYRWGGEVFQISRQESEGDTGSITLTCLGYEHLLDRIKAIQLTRGFGTLTEAERTFFGQAAPVFANRGRRGFSQGIEQVLREAQHNLPLAVTLLMRKYASRVSRMWSTRIQWSRFIDQVALLDDDVSTTRLMRTAAFSRYLRDVFQQFYIVPLSASVDVLLDFMEYRRVCVPSPFYLPFYVDPDAGPPRRRTRRRRRSGGLRVRVSIPALNEPDWEAFYEENPDARFGGRQIGRDRWRLRDGTEFTIPRINYRAATVSGSIDTDRKLRFTPPDGSIEAGIRKEINLSTIVTVLSVLGVQWDPNFLWDQEASREALRENLYTFLTTSLAPGKTITLAMSMPRSRDPAGGPAQVNIEVEVTRLQDRVIEVPAPEPDPAEEPARITDQWAAQLRSHLIVPHLWWALPPACNIIHADEIIGPLSQADAGMEKPTRLLARIAPGLSGSRRSLLDKFFAPRTDDFESVSRNERASDRDVDFLAPYEYIGGVNANIHYYDKLARLARSSDWEKYLSSQLNLQFWRDRIGDSGSVVLRHTPSLTPGFPCVIIRGSDGANLDLDPESARLRARASALRQLRDNIQRCIRRFSPSGSARDLLRYIRDLCALRAAAEFSNIRAQSTDIFPSSVRDQAVMSLQVSLSDRFSAIFSALSRTPWFSVTGAPEATYRNYLAPSVPRSRLVPDLTRVVIPQSAGITEESVRRLIPSDSDNAISGIVTSTSSLPRGIPSNADLRRWFQEAEENASRGVPRVNALQADLRIVEAALRETEQQIAARGISTANAGNSSVLIGYIDQISEQTSNGDTVMQVSFSNLRRLDDDLNWDGAPSDNLEELVDFSDDGLMDPRYHSSRIGESVYKPLLGIGSVADIPEVRELLQGIRREANPEETENPIEDILAQMSGGSEECAAGATGTPGASFTPNEYIRALYQVYQDRRASLRSEELHEWMDNLRNRPGMSVPDAYRGREVLWGDREWNPDVRPDVTRDDELVYGDSDPIPGFFASSFLEEDESPDRVNIAEGRVDASGRLVLAPPVPPEMQLLVERRRRILAYVRSLQDGTILRR